MSNTLSPAIQNAAPQNYFLNNYAAANPTGFAAATAQNAAGGGGGAAIGAATGAAAGSFVPIIGNIIGAVAGATIGGIFDAVQGNQNRKAMERQQREAREMAERQFAWGQNLDRFNMDMTGRQQNEAEKMNRHAITKDRVDRLNEMLRTNVGLQDRVRSLWGGR